MGRWSTSSDVAPALVYHRMTASSGVPWRTQLRLSSRLASRTALGPTSSGDGAAYPRSRVQITGPQSPISKILEFIVDLI